MASQGLTGPSIRRLWRDIQAVALGWAHDPEAALKPWGEVDETWLPVGGEKRPVAVVLGRLVRAVGTARCAGPDD